MKGSANARFAIKSWDEQPYGEGKDSPRLTRAVVTKSFTGDIEGEGRVEYLMMYRRATGGRFPVSSMVVPIMTGENESGVLLLDNFNTPAAFQAVDEAILVSLNQQVALSLENVRLMQTTQEWAGQLEALNEAAAALTSSLHRTELINSLLDRMASVIPYDTAILWLRQEHRMVVTDARGFDDNEERKGLTVAVSESVLLDEMTRTGQPIIVNDVRLDPRFTSLIQPKFLAWMGIPLITKGLVIGVLAIEKAEAGQIGEGVPIGDCYPRFELSAAPLRLTKIELQRRVGASDVRMDSLRLALAVEEQIVCITTGIYLGDQIARLPVECCEFRRASKYDKNAVAFGVKRHRKVCAMRYGPSCALLLRSRINDGNSPTRGQIHK